MIENCVFEKLKRSPPEKNQNLKKHIFGFGESKIQPRNLHL